MPSDAKASMPLPKWDKTHQLLLDVLQVEENRQLTIAEICQKAGFTSIGPWYRASKHPEFRESVKVLRAENERLELNSNTKVGIKGLKWSKTHQLLLDVLQVEENRQLTIAEICQKAGFPNYGYWYRAIEHPQFREAIKALGMDIERRGLNLKVQTSVKVSKWGKIHQQLLDVLQVEENRQLGITELCQKAGFAHTKCWYRATKHPQFRTAVEALGVDIERYGFEAKARASAKVPKWRKIHQQLLDALQVEENRQLTITELCQKVGFASKKCWYTAIKHPQFRAAVEALGVDIERQGLSWKGEAIPKLPEWSKTYQQLLDFLQIEENRQLGIVELCHKAGFTHDNCWYRALEHPRFREAIAALGVNIERQGLYLKGEAKAQREILRVLQDEANRRLPIAEICRKADCSDEQWYKSLRSDDFVKSLQALGVTVKRREYNENGWTEVQQRILDVLQEPVNRELSLTEICQRAGYPNCSYWFRCLKNRRFMATVEELGIKIWRNGRNENGFTRAQQRFLNLLHDNPTITAGDLCRKAGYTGTCAWTQVIQDQHFIAEIEALGFQVQRRELLKDGWTVGQKRLLSVLQIEANHELPIIEVCRMAGYSSMLWYRALLRPPVVSAIKDLGIRIQRCGPDESGWTLAQKRLLRVLEDRENRQLPIPKLCEKASYSDLSRWYESLTSEKFVETLQDWEVPIARQQPRYLQHINVRLTMNLEEDLSKDVWDLRRLKSDYLKHEHPHKYILDFTWIKNPQLRQQVKLYLQRRLPRWKAGTFSAYFYGLKSVLIHLPADVDIETITREHIEAILPTILAQSSDVWANSCLSRTRAMFVYMAHSSYWNGPRPPKNLIDREDIPSCQNPLPRPIPPDVLDQLDPLLEEAIENMVIGREPPILEPMFWDAILILRRTGMRFADLAHLEAPTANNRGGCLGQDSDGDWWIHIRPEKTKMGREHQIPTSVEDGTVEAICRQSERVEDIPDHFSESYLFRTKQAVLTYGAFRKALDKLSRYLSYAGRSYEITPHQFRHTIATDMIDKGVDIIAVKEFLGHKSLSMTLRYIKVYRKGLQAKYQQYRACNKQQSYILPALSTQLLVLDMEPIQPEEIVAGWVEGYEGKLYRFELPNGLGVCEQPPGLQLACTTGGQCSTNCTKLKAGKRHLSAWENRLSGFQMTLEALKDCPGYERSCQQHEIELRQAEKVIATIQTEGYWNGRIHNAERS